MLKYWISRSCSRGEIYSIDKLVIKGNISHSLIDSFFDSFSFFISHSYDLCLFVKDSCRISDVVSQYKYNYNFKLIGSSSCFFACKHNSHDCSRWSWKLEFNPNKCLPDVFLDDLIKFVVLRSTDVVISQLDLAIDFPFSRENFYFDKDRRLSTTKIYESVNDGFSNITEYLSRHNEHGFCKLYNKTIESNLSSDVTRFEITLKSFSFDSVNSAMPDLHFYDNSQLSFDDLQSISKLSQNDSVLLEMSCKYPYLYQKLSYRKRQKLAPYVKAFAPVYVIDYNIFYSLYSEMLERFNFKWMIINV